MKTQLASYQAVHLADEARVQWGEPRKQESSETWTVDLSVDSWPNGYHCITYFGTEAQVRAIAGGHQAMEATDPDQLDVLVVDDAKPEPRPMTDIGAHIFELGGYLNKIATVRSW